jgi:hypothetical protein
MKTRTSLLSVANLAEQIELKGFRIYNKNLKQKGKLRVDIPITFGEWKSFEIFHLVESPDSNSPRHYVVLFHYSSREFEVSRFNFDLEAVRAFTNKVLTALDADKNIG